MPLLNLHFLPIEHKCGCLVDWGVELSTRGFENVDERVAAQAISEFFYGTYAQAFCNLGSYNCPWHGSGTGKYFCRKPDGDEIVGCTGGYCYRLAPESLREAGRLNSKRGRRPV